MNSPPRARRDSRNLGPTLLPTPVNKNPHQNRKSNPNYLVKDKVCQYCPYKTALRGNLKKHERQVHSKGSGYKCDICGYATYYRDILKKHKISHILAKRCPICDYTAQEVNMIETHLKDAHVNEVTKRKCDQCPFTAYHEPIIKEHIAEHGGTTCELCGYRAVSREGLRNHVVKKHDYQQPTQQCSLCDFSSTLVSLLSKHAKDTHGTPYDYVCDSCGKDYLNESKLDNHMKRHSGIKDVKCNLCTFETSQIFYIKRHWEYVHKGVNVETKCQYCDFEVPKLLNLKTKFKHAQVQLATLETHLKVEHNDVAIIGSCAKCKFTAYNKTTMSVHIKSMHDLQCELCSYEGKSPKHLRVHINNAHIRKYLPKKKPDIKITEDQ